MNEKRKKEKNDENFHCMLSIIILRLLFFQAHLSLKFSRQEPSEKFAISRKINLSLRLHSLSLSHSHSLASFSNLLSFIHSFLFHGQHHIKISSFYIVPVLLKILSFSFISFFLGKELIGHGIFLSM